MNSSSQLESIFFAALSIGTAAERAAYLDEACAGDDELRRRLERMLEAQAGGFMQQPVLGHPTADYEPIKEGPGEIIGPYKLMEQIGEGGFGLVFLAEQHHPVRRKVALKIIKPGMDTRDVIARFEAERQALALMDHPNIAKVFDAGATESGRPYFVMELVPGIPVTDYCDQCNLTTRDQLELFISVCQAVQHAHQKGLIHRDIKPNNVLVAIQDGRPAPKIIDFGVAKAIDQRLTEHTQMTAFAQMVGTPLYMSPEQAELCPLGVDTRSDIYSLGVVLYELLTGTTPFDKDRLHSASFDELRHIIREEEPPRPSARITTLAAERASTVAEHRRSDPRRLQQTVRGELDWIVMKCLEKDRNRRYETPSALARDIERYLHDEPVQACPPSTAYRVKKFARRNKVAVAFLALLVTGVAGLGVSNVVIKQERDAKTQALAQAKAVSDLLQKMLSSADIERGQGTQYTVRELLDDFSAGLGDQLDNQPAVEADIRATIGRAYGSLGTPDKAQPHFERAIELRRQLDGPQHENVAAILVDYGGTLAGQMRFDEAEAQLHEALNIYRQQGVTGAPVIHALSVLQTFLISRQETTGRDDEAERVTQEALAVARGSGEDVHELAAMLHRLAYMRRTQSRLTEAEQLARQAIDMLRGADSGSNPQLAYGLRTLAFILQEQQKFDDAASAFRESLAIFRRCYPEDHPDVRSAVDWLKLAVERRGDTSEIDEMEIEQAILDRPSEQLRLAGLLLTEHGSGSAHEKEAQRLVHGAIDEYGRVAVEFPGNLDRRLGSVKGYQTVAAFCATNPLLADEIDLVHRRLTTELEELLAAFPNSAECQVKVAQHYAETAYFSITHQRQEEAAELLRKAALAVERVQDPAQSLNALYYLAMARMRLGDEAGYRQVCEAMLQTPGDRGNDSIGMRRAWIWCLGPHPNEDLSQALKNAEDFVAHNSLRAPYFDHNVLGGMFYRVGQFERAVEHLQKSIDAYPSDAPPAYGTVFQPKLFLAMTYWKMNERDEARRLLTETRPAINEWLQSPLHFWTRRAIHEVLLREAEGLIEPSDAAETVENQNVNSSPTMDD